MNTLSAATILSLSLSGMIGCAGTQERSEVSAMPSRETRSGAEVDEAYVARVESLARRRGVEVIWINLPNERTARQDDD